MELFWNIIVSMGIKWLNTMQLWGVSFLQDLTFAYTTITAALSFSDHWQKAQNLGGSQWIFMKCIKEGIIE